MQYSRCTFWFKLYISGYFFYHLTLWIATALTVNCFCASHEDQRLFHFIISINVSWIFPLHSNTYVMGVRPLYIFYRRGPNLEGPRAERVKD